LNIILWPRKKVRRQMNSKGFSSIVGAIFMMLIVWVLASAYFIFTMSQNTIYNAAVREKHLLDIERMSESVKLLDANCSVTADDNVNVAALIQNTGPSSIQFITSWVYVSNNTWANYNFSKLTVAVKGGDTCTLNITMRVDGVCTNGNYYMAPWLITARGNKIALPKLAALTNALVIAQTTQGIGALAMDFQDFVYYNVTGSTLDNFPSGAPGYAVSSAGNNIAFRIILTNLDPSERSITLYSSSVFFSIFPTTPQQVRGTYWYIVNVDDTGVISSTYTNVTLPFNVPTAVYFASNHAIEPRSPFIGSKPLFTGTAPVNLALIGTIGDSPFGQNIPFVSIQINS